MPCDHRMMKDNWYGKFKGCGYRITIPRQAIIELLQKTDKHLSAEDVYIEVHKKFPQIGLTTVYRTLEILTGMGIIFKSDFGDGRFRYELVEGSHIEHHHHLVCTQCKRIIDYTDFIDEEVEFLKRVEKGLSKKHKFNITNHIIQFYGLCEQCGKKE
ncbi:MAG: transcriptional repressor [Candidatus Omnitrophica bacterium]|nr:transcriptional repressor [Candidatus Omnitrophota bacterium]